jgi:hypothetical protein
MKNIYIILSLLFSLLLMGCGKPSYQEFQKKYPECTTAYTNILVNQKKCTEQRMIDSTFSCEESEFAIVLDNNLAFLKEQCTDFIEEFDYTTMKNTCDVNKKTDTLEDEIDIINCYLHYVGYSE